MSFTCARFRGLRVRPLHAHDDDALELVFDALSARSRFLRFHAPTPRLTGALRRGMLDVDGWSRFGLIAEVAGRHPIGIAHLVGTGPGEAEFALAVADRWQARGVGRTLLAGLQDLAVGRGFRHLHGEVLLENRAMLRLAGSALPGSRTTTDGLVVRVGHDLERPLLASLTGDDIMADLVGWPTAV